MRTHARAVVIGGGVVGVSSLYHLVKKGWTDSVLIERKELTSGSTWHAAGLLPLFNLSYSVGQIHKYSLGLYKTLGAETGLDVGLRQVTNIRLARTQDRLDEYRYYAGVAASIGVEVNFLSPAQVKEIWPLCEIDGILGAIQHPQDGYIQPADLTQALARGARNGGGEIIRQCCVTMIDKLPSGEWKVTTDRGEIICEHVVSATGNFARRTGAMIGLNVPVIPVQHQYVVTQAHPEILKRKAQGLPELGVLRESDSSWYMREEAGGLLLGPYELGAPACYIDGPSPQSEYELFQEDLDRLAPYIETAITRVPAFGEVGIKKVYNGAIAYTPDGSPIIGPAPGKHNFWLNEGHSFGVTAAGGAGWQLAEWIVEGVPSIDMLGVDPRRFGPYAQSGFLGLKNEEAYAKVFTVHYPDEERIAARPLRQTPCYSRMRDLGAVFGSVFGWERPNWFAPQEYRLNDAALAKPETLLNNNHAEVEVGAAPKEKWSFRRSNYFDFVGAECRNVHENVGLQDMSAFAKFEVSGAGAAAWLDSLLTNKTPATLNRITLTYLLTPHGGVQAEFTLTKVGPERFYLISAGALESHDFDYLQGLCPRDGSVRIDKVTTQIGVLVLAGPRSREILARATGSDLSNAAFPWLTARTVSIGAASALAMRVNFIGELGYEIHHPIEMQNYIFDRLFATGEEFGIKPFGIRAMDSLRLEKSYKLIGRELSIEYSALESGLVRFIDMNKPQFIGREALVARSRQVSSKRLVALEVHGVKDADARGSEPIFQRTKIVGRTTSGGFGWRVQKSLALGMVEPPSCEIGAELEIQILGVRHRATIIADCPFDPKNVALRG